MRELFEERRRSFYQRLATYLPYVFNDHFVLVLMVGLGVLLYQYRELLNNPPSSSFWLYGLFCVFGLGLLSVGQVATYILPPDRHYLLTKETVLVGLVKEANRRAALFGSLVQLAGWCLLYPLLHQLGWSVWSFIAFLIVVTLVKLILANRRLMRLGRQNGLDWDKLVTTEAQRQQRLLQFFALFTNVKGITSSVKKRPYLNVLNRFAPKGQGKLYHQLFWRAFLRSGDYLGLFLRLTGLAMLSLFGVSSPYLGAGLAGMLNFLLSFQLLALSNHYDHHYLLKVMPLAGFGQKTALLWLIRRLSLVALLIELPFAKTWSAALLLTAINVVVLYAYMPHKAERMIDETAQNR
ncbi:ABC transporter permease [Streptococcus entericus]|uniref:ABC transporter permease n=1 Tax=Streptococcus entericus TaxID=155680 RepID=UPI000376BEA0|nr:ABC transporter permease [Streptococcus entericus]